MPTPRRKLRAVAYLRVSTDRQAEQGLGLDVQRQCIRDWAKKEGARVVAWETDEGISGTKDVSERPALAAALGMLADGQADALVMARLDRLARKLDVQEAVLAQAWRQGGRVFTCDGGEVLQDDPDDPMRTAMRQMMGTFSQLERSMIAARMRAGRRRKAELGGFAYGSPPYGYRSKDGKLVQDPAEQAAIQRALELRAGGLSLRHIADTLDREGHRPRRGRGTQPSRWHPTTLARVLKRADAAGGDSAEEGKE